MFLLIRFGSMKFDWSRHTFRLVNRAKVSIWFVQKRQHFLRVVFVRSTAMFGFTRFGSIWFNRSRHTLQIVKRPEFQFRLVKAGQHFFWIVIVRSLRGSILSILFDVRLCWNWFDWARHTFPLVKNAGVSIRLFKVGQHFFRTIFVHNTPGHVLIDSILFCLIRKVKGMFRLVNKARVLLWFVKKRQ